MSALADELASYLSVRRALGFKLVEHERLLEDLVGYLKSWGAETLTAQLAIMWATRPPDAGPARWSRRLSAARGFATHLLSVNPDTEVPPTHLWPGYRRPEPFVLSPLQISALVDAARSLGPPFKSATYHTLIGLLAVTGLRLGEAIRLNDGDVDLVAGVVAVRNAKFHKSREVPLHPTTTAALTAYLRLRNVTLPERSSPSLFVSCVGTRLHHERVQAQWRKLVERVGIPPRHDGRQPRVHDLRHSFAVNTLRSWHDQRRDVEVRLPLLSTYLGHINPASTYWYLTATPDLLTTAARRLEAFPGGAA